MPDSANSAAPEDRLVRVFVSSTFRDMRAERDELTKRVFPKLRRLCEERGVTFVDVDLRWGVTDEEAAEGKVLPICLAEIHRCRPFFIGLLGERYGWVPQEIPQELIDQEPWLAEHRQKSVTELEILHGVLNNPEMTNRAIFYFRDPKYPDGLSADERAEFAETDPARRAKLRALKARIQESHVAWHDNYPDPKTLGQWVLDDLTVAINQTYPPGPPPGPLERQAAEHEAFARSRCGVYIGRPEYFDRLDSHAAGNGPPLVLLGESGGGKSALVANWAARYRREHPDALVLMHFIGGTPYSADWAAMLRRILGELKRRLGIEGEIPDKPDALRATFANWLHMAAARCGQLPSPTGGRGAGGEGTIRPSKIILILDALNQLEDRDGAPDLVWLPPEIPGEVRLVLSTLPGRPLDDLTRRGWPVMRVEPLEAEERKELIRRYLAQYRKKLSRDRVERIAGAQEAANPLYLRALLDELRVFGVHERLDERIDHYLAAQTGPELYGRILHRWEEDYERDRPGLVRDAMTALWAARRGLSESELLDLLGSDDGPLPRAHWSPLYLAAEESLVERSGLIGFFHDFLREAVREQYLPGEEAQHAAHRRLADSFEATAPSARRIDELPWQLAEAQSWQRLFELLADLPFFQAAWDADEFEVKAYWARIEAHSPLRMVDAYGQALDAPERYKDFVWCLGMLLAHSGHPQEASRLCEYLVSHYRETGDRTNLQVALGAQALILQARGDLDGAMALHKEAERICRELGNKDGLSASLGNQALILQTRGDLDGAMTLHKQQERICRELGNVQCAAISLANQAHLLVYSSERPREALPLAEEAYRLAREHGYAYLAERQIKPILDGIRARLQ